MKKKTISYSNREEIERRALKHAVVRASSFKSSFKFFREVERRELNLTFPVMFNPVTWDAHLFPVFFGGSVVSDSLTIESAPSVQLAYFITVDSPRQDAM